MNKPATSAAEYAQNTRDENKQRELHPADCGALDLDTFRALDLDTQRRTWALASDADRRGLALQAIRRCQHGPSEATIALYLELFEAKFGGSDMLIPDRDALLAVISERSETARRHDDYPGARQLDKARLNLDRGARLAWLSGDLVIQSVNNPGAVYSVSGRRCTCPNGAAGKSQCWHVALFDLLLEMLDERAATADMAAEAAAELAIPDGTADDDFSDVGERAPTRIPNPESRTPATPTRLDDPARVASLVSRIVAARARLAA